MITNPILKGFNPDPSILRVGDDYYIATSTFEWFPGVQIHHSRDLKNWRLLTRPLTRQSQLNMTGLHASSGIWAPCLSYDHGVFYLIYTVVKSIFDPFINADNYLVTAENILGPWSEPVYLNSSGFDPSLFHDEDGRKWLVNMLYDHRPDRNTFSGIVIQEYSGKEKKLIGPVKNIFKGTSRGCTEGPHIYRYNGYYYLMAAEGGTGYPHCVTMARAKELLGEYEVDPENPMLTAADDENNPLQKAGHASLVRTQNGKWYLAHLCARPVKDKRCILGRESSIQEVYWNEEGWLRLKHGGHNPILMVEETGLTECPFEKERARDDFDSEELNIHFQTLRIPLGEEWVTLKERKGYLRLYGAEALSSRFRQCLVARRQQSFCYRAQTCVEFEPDGYQQMAGLLTIYDTENYYYLRITDTDGKKTLGVIRNINGKVAFPEKEIDITGSQRVHLRLEVNREQLHFYYALEKEEEFLPVGEWYDASTLSDEFCREGCFTGTFVGICCQDMFGYRKYADFDYFEYIEDKEEITAESNKI